MKFSAPRRIFKAILVLLIFTTSTDLFAQTIIFQSGFESGDPAFTYATDGGGGTCSNVAVAPNVGANHGRLLGAGANGSIITPLVTFTAGKYYRVEVYAKAIKCVQSIKIKKSLTATNTAMIAAAGADIILNGTNNITLTTYQVFSGTFLGVNETKYVGFQIINGSCGGAGTSTTDIDDIRIIEYNDPPCSYYCQTGTVTAITSYLSGVQFNTLNRPSGWDGYICTGVQTSVQRTSSYNLAVSYRNQTTSQKFVAAWIDYNRNGSYADPGEQVLANTDVTTLTPPVDLVVNQNVTIPAGAALGYTKMRVGMVIGTSAQMIPCSPNAVLSDFEDYDVEILPAPTPMTYVSSITTQINTSPVNAGTFRNEIVGLQIVTTGTLTPISATSFSFTTTGTTAPLVDISNVQLWYTSNNNGFATTTQVGATIAGPNGTFTFAGAVPLIQGINYFWLTYDIPVGATSPDVVDATCTSVTIAGTPRVPSITAPAGNRPIITASPMVFVSSTVTQNVSRSPRPDTNHQIIGIEVVTSGAASPLSVTSFSFNTTGTSATVTNNIQNARLWTTGTISAFATTTQIGATIAAPNGAFVITPAINLLNGTNYFWLTYDIPATAGCDPTQADAQCTSITVAGTPRIPTVTSPLGAVVIDCLTAYYSKGNLPANVPSSWNTLRNGAGANATTLGAGSMFYVQNGHTMNTTAAATIPFMTIEAGGRVNASFLLSMTDLRINSFGTFEQIVQATNGNYITNFFIENYGTWIHNNAGFLPSINRYFSPRSNQWFYQWGGGTFPAGTSWGNVLLNGVTPGNFGMGAVLTTIQGDFEWRRIGNNNYLLDEQNETINIGGNLIFSGGWWKIAYDNSVPGNQTRSVIVNVAGDFIMTSGTLEDYTRGDAASGATLNVNGNVTITGGTMNFNLSPGGASVINLTVGNPSMNWSQTGGTITLSNTNVKAGKTAYLTGNKIGDVATARTLIVETGAKLYTSNFPVTGGGNFSLQTGAWLGIGSAAGITSAGATGNVQVSGTRSYHSGATYEYYEGLTPQATGNFVTSLTNATYPSQVANLIINKTTPANIVNLTNTTDVNGTLTLTSGILTTSFTPATAPWVRIPVAGTVSPVGGSVNSYVDGYIRRQGATAFVMPTGNTGRWRRIAFTAPSVTTEFEARYVATPYVNTTTMAPAPFIVLDHISTIEHWYLAKPLGNDAATTKVQLFWEDASLSGVYKFDSLGVARWSGSGWENANCYGSCPANWTASTAERTYTGIATGTGIGTIQSNTVSAFGPFTLSSIGIFPLNPLPVELLGFEANCIGEEVELKWSTASEQNNEYFTIERSNNGISFAPITRIGGAGNSTSLRNYKFIDSNPFRGINYYRLIQTDFDGRSEISNAIYVDCDRFNSNFIDAFSDNQSQIIISLNATQPLKSKVIITDALGKLIHSSEINSASGFNQHSLDVSSLSPGVYFIRVINHDRNFGKKIFIR